MRGMLASGLVRPSKWVGQSVMSNRMYRQGLEGRPRKNLAFLKSESGSPKKWCAIQHENRRNEAYARFGPTNGPKNPWWPTVCIENVLTNVHEKFGIFDVGIRITQKMVCYSTRKSLKWGVCLLWGSFDPLNGPDNPWCPTVCIDKVLTDVHEKIWHFWRRNPDHPKNGVL